MFVAGGVRRVPGAISGASGAIPRAEVAGAG